MKKKLSKIMISALLLTLVAIPITSINRSTSNNNGFFTILVDWPDPF